MLTPRQVHMTGRSRCQRTTDAATMSITFIRRQAICNIGPFTCWRHVAAAVHQRSHRPATNFAWKSMSQEIGWLLGVVNESQVPLPRTNATRFRAGGVLPSQVPSRTGAASVENHVLSRYSIVLGNVGTYYRVISAVATAQMGI